MQIVATFPDVTESVTGSELKVNGNVLFVYQETKKNWKQTRFHFIHKH